MFQKNDLVVEEEWGGVGGRGGLINEIGLDKGVRRISLP